MNGNGTELEQAGAVGREGLVLLNPVLIYEYFRPWVPFHVPTFTSYSDQKWLKAITKIAPKLPV